jgi:hypothetical protein
VRTTPLLQRRDDVEPIAVAEPHVDHRVERRRLLDLQQSVGHGLGSGHHEAARLERAGEPGQEGLVVLDDQQRPFSRNRSGGNGLGHGSHRHRFPHLNFNS